MAVRPAVPGLLKHQLRFSQGALETSVTTIWTYKNAYPVAAQRVADEQLAIHGWIIGYWATISGSGISMDRIRTWDMGATPPARYADRLVFPRVFGSGGNTLPYGVSAVVALRSQAVGSAVRNRLNGRLYHPAGANFVNWPAGTTANTGTIVNVYHELRNRLDPAADADVGDWVIVSWRSGNAWRVAPVIVGVDHVLVYGEIGFQASRMAKQTAYARGA